MNGFELANLNNSSRLGARGGLIPGPAIIHCRRHAGWCVRVR